MEVTFITVCFSMMMRCIEQDLIQALCWLLGSHNNSPAAAAAAPASPSLSLAPFPHSLEECFFRYSIPSVMHTDYPVLLFLILKDEALPEIRSFSNSTVR